MCVKCNTVLEVSHCVAWRVVTSRLYNDIEKGQKSNIHTHYNHHCHYIHVLLCVLERLLRETVIIFVI